jgi:hypothetical protein
MACQDPRVKGGEYAPGGRRAVEPDREGASYEPIAEAVISGNWKMFHGDRSGPCSRQTD